MLHGANCEGWSHGTLLSLMRLTVFIMCHKDLAKKLFQKFHYECYQLLCDHYISFSEGTEQIQLLAVVGRVLKLYIQVYVQLVP